MSRWSRGQHLQHHIPVEPSVTGAVDAAHAAFPEEGCDVIVPEAGAGAEGHDLLSLLTGLVYAQAVQRVHRQAQNRPEKAHARLLRESVVLDGVGGGLGGPGRA